MQMDILLLIASFLCPGEEDRKIRLGSNGGNDTRLELCRGNLWGSLCVNDSWDDEDATVACRELGYTTGREYLNIQCDFKEL